MLEALISNKIDFVKLLLQNGVVMRDFLTVGRLRKLYNSVNEPVFHIICSLSDVSDFDAGVAQELFIQAVG